MKLFIAGHNGMVGAALVRRFRDQAGVDLVLRSRRELDLTSQPAVDAFYAAEKPDVTIVAAAKVGLNEGMSVPDLSPWLAVTPLSILGMNSPDRVFGDFSS